MADRGKLNPQNFMNVNKITKPFLKVEKEKNIFKSVSTP